ncbi:MAG: Tim44 domain-containing protein [Burkholderiaceae bacterium]
MKKSNWLAVAAAAFLAGAPIIEAEAKRLGSGSNMGRVAPGSGASQAVPAKPAQPQAAPQAAKPATANPAAAQAATRSSWMGPIAGLAAGLGLAALASYLGFGEELMSLMLILLAVVVVFAVFRMLAGRRQASAGQYGQPAMAKTGYGNNELGAEARPSNVSWPAQMGSSAGGSAGGGAGVSGYAGAAGVGGAAQVAATDVSAEEIAQFVKVASEQFNKLQSIWDSGDIHTLAEFCTPEMTRELSHQIAGRKGSQNLTQVVQLDSEWLGMADSQDDFGKPVDEVHIRFSGLIREAADAAASDFNEIWTLHRVKNGDTGWQLAGITQVD